VTANAVGTTPPPYGLRLAAVRLQDFRALHDLQITLARGTTVLVGENNSGKTSLLQALSVALGQRRPQLDDLFNGPSGTAPSFELDLRLEPMDGDEFNDTVRDIVGNGIQLEDPEYFNLRVVGSVSAEGWDITLQRAFIKGWADCRADAAKLQVLDSPSVSRQVLDLLHYDMLDARRDIVEQLRNRRTHWGRTTSTISIPPPDRAKLEDSLRELSDEVTSKSKVLNRVKTSGIPPIS